MNPSHYLPSRFASRDPRLTGDALLATDEGPCARQVRKVRELSLQLTEIRGEPLGSTAHATAPAPDRPHRLGFGERALRWLGLTPRISPEHPSTISPPDPTSAEVKRITTELSHASAFLAERDLRTLVSRHGFWDSRTVWALDQPSELFRFCSPTSIARSLTDLINRSSGRDFSFPADAGSEALAQFAREVRAVLKTQRIDASLNRGDFTYDAVPHNQIVNLWDSSLQVLIGIRRAREILTEPARSDMSRESARKLCICVGEGLGLGSIPVEYLASNFAQLPLQRLTTPEAPHTEMLRASFEKLLATSKSESAGQAILPVPALPPLGPPRAVIETREQAAALLLNRFENAALAVSHLRTEGLAPLDRSAVPAHPASGSIEEWHRLVETIRQARVQTDGAIRGASDYGAGASVVNRPLSDRAAEHLARARELEDADLTRALRVLQGTEIYERHRERLPSLDKLVNLTFGKMDVPAILNFLAEGTGLPQVDLTAISPDGLALVLRTCRQRVHSGEVNILIEQDRQGNGKVMRGIPSDQLLSWLDRIERISLPEA